MFFDGWSDLATVLVTGTVTYVALVAMLRVSGKRTLASLNAFDFVVTVALGSTLASVILSPDVSIAEGVAALAVLIGLQYLVAIGVRRSRRIERLAKAEPTMLAYRGRLLHRAMASERITHTEILSAIRAYGFVGLSDTEAVVLETDGSITVVERLESPSSFEGLPIPRDLG